MNKIKLSIKIIRTAAYGVCLYIIWHLCQYGGSARHLQMIIVPVIVFIASIVGSIILAVKTQRKEMRKKMGTADIAIGLVSLFMTAFFVFAVLKAATPYNGHLSWKVEEWKNTRYIKLTHTNIYESGMDGIVQDLRKGMDMPEELYINQAGVDIHFERDGQISSLEAYLYGKEDDGKTVEYIVIYNVRTDKRMRVITNRDEYGEYETDEEGMRLQPMLDIMKQMSLKTDVDQFGRQPEGTQYGILYYGKRTFEDSKGFVFLDDEKSGAKEAGDNSSYGLDSPQYGAVEGYEVSLYVSGKTKEITPIRYMMNWRFVSGNELEQRKTREQSERAKEVNTWSTESDGSVHFFLTDKIGYRLVVGDAAAGSRFYYLEGSVDSGERWTKINENPFADNIGVAEGLEFFDESQGFAGLQGASGGHSKIYVTQDGGQTFREVVLPAELPKEADAFSMPERLENGDFVMYVSEDIGDTVKVTLKSSDGGISWGIVQ